MRPIGQPLAPEVKKRKSHRLDLVPRVPTSMECLHKYPNLDAILLDNWIRLTADACLRVVDHGCGNQNPQQYAWCLEHLQLNTLSPLCLVISLVEFSTKLFSSTEEGKEDYVNLQDRENDSIHLFLCHSIQDYPPRCESTGLDTILYKVSWMDPIPDPV